LFEGSLNEGVDVKATLRSAARGENYVYVRDTPRATHPAGAPETDPEPTVFIFDSSTNHDSGHWASYGAGGDELGKYVADYARFADVVARQGEDFVAAVSYYEYESLPDQMQKFVSALRLLTGITVFGNPCLNAVQAARWLESTHYSCSPVSPSLDLTTLVRIYSERHGMSIDRRDWSSALIQFALPYARRRVVVVAPDHFAVSAVAAHEARRHGIRLDVLPLSYFAAREIRAMRRQYIVRTLDADGSKYPPELERLLGQSENAYLQLLPEQILAQAEG
jgi:hypothetical protein